MILVAYRHSKTRISKLYQDNFGYTKKRQLDGPALEECKNREW